jgi:4-carboxymuconolactone decarboxylase
MQAATAAGVIALCDSPLPNPQFILAASAATLARCARAAPTGRKRVTAHSKPTSEAFEAGLETRRKVLGPDYAERQLQDPDDFTAPFQLHLRGAMRNGVTRAELQELCLHSFLYCGGPASLDAFHVIKAALPEIEALEKAAGPARK